MDKPPFDPHNPWLELRRLTPARIALGRTGTSMPTRAQLDFQYAHAQARDAVHLPFDHKALSSQLAERGRESILLHSAAIDRNSYLQRPDLGRKLSDESAQILRDYASAHPGGVDLAIIVADGLSALAVHRHTLPFLARLEEQMGAENWSMAPVILVEQGRVAVADEIGELLGANVPLAKDTYGEDAQAKVAAMNDGDVVLLENVRFNPEETSKDADERAAYAKKIAALGEAFVSDGFGVVHRAQGSNYDVAADLPAAAGLLVEKEVKALSRATVNPERPLTVVLGGSKVSDKLGVIDNLLDKANRLVIGGGMAYTFLKAKGYEVGTSLLEEDQLEKVKGYIETAEKNGVELVLPTDVVVNAGFPAGDTPVAPEVVAADAIPADKMGLDIGPESQKLFHDKIVDSKTVVWNGPMGVFEVPEFAAGTKAVAQALVDATAAGAFTIVGGGDSASAVRNLGFPEDGFSHISTGGGAFLEFVEGKVLPAVEVLESRAKA